MGDYLVTCPFCGFKGDDEDDFHVSAGDECSCPKCKGQFELEPGDTDDEPS